MMALFEMDETRHCIGLRLKELFAFLIVRVRYHVNHISEWTRCQLRFYSLITTFLFKSFGVLFVHGDCIVGTRL